MRRRCPITFMIAEKMLLIITHVNSLITLRSACDDPSGGRRPAHIPQLDTPQACIKGVPQLGT